MGSINGKAIALGACLAAVACSSEETFGDRVATPPRDAAAGEASATGPEERPSLEAPAVFGEPRLLASAGAFEPPPSCQPTKARCDAFGEERPNRLSEHVAVYADDKLQMLVHGGTETVPVACAIGGPVRYESALWIYDDPCGAWEKVSSPVTRSRHAGAYARGSLWLFGGRYRDPESTGVYTLYNDLWSYDTDTGKWEQREVPGLSPSPRYGAKMVYDDLRGQLWLFGGSTDTDGVYLPSDELWSFSLEDQTWSQHPGSGAEPRVLFGMDFDVLRGRLIVFGGADSQAFTRGVYRADLWAYDVDDGAWSLLAASEEGPMRRFFPALAYAADADAYLVFGGHDDSPLGNRNDAWLLDPFAQEAAVRWTEYAHLDTGRPAGDVLAGEARAVCDFPPDFTDLDPRAPERRNAHSLVYSVPCGHALLFGGKTDCGAIDDVWQFDLRGGWQERLPAKEGESCIRWRDDPSVCADLCF